MMGIWGLPDVAACLAMATEKVERVCCLYRLGDNSGSLEIIYLDGVSTVTLGRAETNDYQLNESAAVSRRHAILETKGDGMWSITDLASSNGIYVNYERIEASKPHPLADRDIVEIGKDPRSNQPAAYRFQFYKQAKIKRPSSSDDNNVRAKRLRVSQHSNVAGAMDENNPLQEVQTNQYGISPSKALLKQKMEEQELLLRKEMEERQKEAESKVKALEEELARREEEQRSRMEEIQKQKSQLASELEEQKEQKERLNAEQEELGKRLQETEQAKESMAQRLQEEQDRITKQLQEQEDIKHQLAEKEAEYSSRVEAARLEAERQINQLTELLEAKEMQQEEMEQQKTSIEAQLQLQKEQLALEQEKFEEEMKQKLDQQLLEQVEQVKTELEQEMNQLQEERKKVEESLQAQLTKQLQEKDQQLEQELRKQQESLNSKLAQKEQEQKSLQEQLIATKSEVEQAKESGQKARQAMTSQLEDLMESELICAICSEFFIQATSLNCSHSFCALCIGKWMDRKKECPNCRAKITSYVRSLVLDNYIDKMVQYLGEEQKERRREMVQERKAEQALRDEAKKKANGGRTTPTPPAVVAAQGNNRAEQLAFDITQYLQGQQNLPRAIQGQRIPRVGQNQPPALGLPVNQARQNIAAVAAAMDFRLNQATPNQIPAATAATNQRTAAGPVPANNRTGAAATAAPRVDPRRVVPGTSGMGVRVQQGHVGQAGVGAGPALAHAAATTQASVRVAPYIPPTATTAGMGAATNQAQANPVMYINLTNPGGLAAPGAGQYQTLYFGTNTVTVPVAQVTNQQRHARQATAANQPRRTVPTTAANQPQTHRNNTTNQQRNQGRHHRRR